MADSGRDESFNESHSGRGKGVHNEERVWQRKKKSGRQRERRVPNSGEKCPAVEKKVPGRRIGSFLSGLMGSGDTPRLDWDTLDRQGRRKCRRDWMGSGDTLRLDWDTIGVCWIGIRWIESVCVDWSGMPWIGKRWIRMQWTADVVD